MAGKKKKAAGRTSTAQKELLKSIPKVDEFLGWISKSKSAPVLMVKNLVRELLAEKRQSILAGDLFNKKDLSKSAMVKLFKKRIKEKLSPNFKTLINATGVVIHTNLGRSILPAGAIEVLTRAGGHYSNLEFNLASGKRGSRYSLVEDLLCELTGAEAALVVNNNAAAVLLVLETLAKRREVVVSRGQLVEIGGSFRIPDVMAKSGAKLVEVGATNRTHLKDYEAAINKKTAMLLKVHASNFKVIGFTVEVPIEDLLTLTREHDLVLMEDLGSGCLVDLSKYGLRKEPTVQEVVAAGVDVVTFSGDKLLGGPQAGIILGKQEIVDRIKRNQLTRALRIDKFTLAGLETVLRLYFDKEKAIKNIPTLAMLTMPLADIEKRAKKLIRAVKKKLAAKCDVKTIETGSKVGGGALPEEDMASMAVALDPLDRSVNKLEYELRQAELPVIGRIADDLFLLDMRTVSDDEVKSLAESLLKVFN